MRGKQTTREVQSKIALLSSIGIPYDHIAKQEEIAKMTVRKYGPHDSRFDSETVSVKRMFTKLIEHQLLRVIAHLTEDKLERSSGAQIMLGIGILTDKWNALTVDQNKPLVALQIVGLTNEQMQGLVVKELPSKTEQATPQDVGQKQ